MVAGQPQTVWKELGVFELDGKGQETVTITGGYMDAIKLERVNP